jgi:hypothetical protein
MLSRRISLFFSVSVMLFIAGCYPKGPTYVSDLDMIVTNYDPSFPFSEESTYLLIDSVVHIIDEQADIDRTWDDDILEGVEENLDNRGYTRVTDFQEADMIVHISAWSNTSTTYVYDWWGSWGWYYDPWYGWGGGGWYYPWGPGYSYSYTFGTVLIEISDPNGVDFEDLEVPLIWTGALNGLISGSDAQVRKRIVNGIDQCFEQSPYLMAN